MKTTFLVNFNQDLVRDIQSTHSTSKYTTSLWFLNIDLCLKNIYYFSIWRKRLTPLIIIFWSKNCSCIWYQGSVSILVHFIFKQSNTDLQNETIHFIAYNYPVWSSPGVERRTTYLLNLQLGVVIDESLSCNISKKVSKAIGIIKKC